ncbi:MAG: hypothetical protein AB8E82_17755, partial [Aureispira sp.]
MRPVLRAILIFMLGLLPILVSAQLVRTNYTYELLDETGTSVTLNDAGTNIDICAHIDYLFRVTVTGAASNNLTIKPPTTNGANVILNKQTSNTAYCVNAQTVHTCSFRVIAAGTYSIGVGRRNGGNCNYVGGADVDFNFQAQNNSYFELDPTYDVCSGAAFVLTQEGAGSNDR